MLNLVLSADVSVKSVMPALIHSQVVIVQVAASAYLEVCRSTYYYYALSWPSHTHQKAI